MKTFFTAVFILVIVSLFSCAGLQDRPVHIVTASGSAEVYAEDTTAAKDRAVDDALLALVGTSYTNKAEKALFQKLQPFLNIRSAGVVSNWKVLQEKQENGRYYVQLRGAVNIERRNKVIARRKEELLPAMLLLLREERDGKKAFAEEAYSYSVFLDELTRRKVPVVTYGDAVSRTQKEKPFFEETMSSSVHAQNRTVFMDEIDCDVLLVGTVTVSDQTQLLKEYDTDMKSKRVVVNLRTIDVYTGRILASVSDNTAGVHVNPEEAVIKAVQNSIKKREFLGIEKDTQGTFVTQTYRTYLELLAKRSYTINVSGSAARARGFTRSLINSSNRVISAEVSEEKADNCTVSVIFSGSAEDLRSLIQDEEYGLSRKYSVTQVRADSLSVSVL